MQRNCCWLSGTGCQNSGIFGLVTEMLPTNRGFNAISKRAETNASATLRDTFVDSGVMGSLESWDHQVLFGRRGTGKTHALRYLQEKRRGRGDIAIYIDLRTVGSPDSLLMSDTSQTLEATRRILVDLLDAFYTELLAFAVKDAALASSEKVNKALSALQETMATVRVDATENVREAGASASVERRASMKAGVSLASVGAEASAEFSGGQTSNERTTTTFSAKPTLRFSGVAKAMRDVAAAFSPRRIWIILDEWSSQSPQIQPKLAEFVKRCILPVQGLIVKIGAIEQQSRFREVSGETVLGIEIGADVSANIDLDDFMVFELSQDRARDFFRGLMHRHPVHAMTELGLEPPATEQGMISMAFTDTRAFDELVRAGEGVPRDAINIAGQAAMQSVGDKISVPRVRQSARSWYQKDKEGALRSQERPLRLLNWIIDRVIRGKATRGFLVDQRSANAPALRDLFDSRVLHLVKRGYSAQDEPGVRFDVYLIDYGAYVDLINTKVAPVGNFTSGVRGDIPVDVPPQDMRAMRRAILDVDEFERSEVVGEDTDRSAASGASRT